MRKILYFGGLLSFFLGGMLAGPLAAADYKTVTLAEGLPRAWSLVILPDKKILIASKGGSLTLLRQDGQKKRIAKFAEAVSHGQGGLMDLTLSPNFSKDKLIYYSWTQRDKDGGYGTALGSFRLEEDKIHNKKTLLRAANLGFAGVHFGSRIVFDEKGFLFLSLGDRGQPQQAQSLATHKGKLLRLTKDGEVPADNPFVNQKGALPHIYSYGHRNPQGLIFDEGKIWLHEHGPRGGDELNFIHSGANYGWPVISHGINYDGSKVGEGASAKPGMEQPLVYWVPSIAPSGMIRYRGDKFPEWRGDFFIGALAGRHLRRVIMNGDVVAGEEELLMGRARIREVAQDAEGYIYVLTDEARSKLLRLEPPS